MLAGQTPQPPISRLTGMRLVEIGEGTAAFRIPLTEWLCAPQGAISIGPITMPADAAVACAIQTVLGPATPFTTSELSLRLLSPVHPGGSLTARGRLIQSRRTIALAEVTVLDAHERIVAHGSSMCFVASPVSPVASPVSPAADPLTPAAQQPDHGPEEDSGAAAPDEPTPDPYLRPVQGHVLPETTWQSTSGLDVMLEQLAGRLPQPPIHHLTGLRPTDAADGEVRFVMPASEWLCAPARGRVQGGAVALLAESALSAAIQTRMPAGTAIAPVDLKVNYLRPLATDGRLAHARGHVVHAGRRIAVAGAEVFDADGKAIAVATGSAMVLRGRAASLRVAGD
ncbi:MAG: hypothetical protein QOD66_2 [Solirubrobacteraceae bacterium]|nr:hypothetical protein [Solirubrobacteraceae bacterium]